MKASLSQPLVLSPTFDRKEGDNLPVKDHNKKNGTLLVQFPKIT